MGTELSVIILAAGEGKRLRPITDDKPKCLATIEGKSLIEYQLEVLKDSNLQKIHLVGGYKSEALSYLNLPTFVNHNYETTNMVESLRIALSEIAGDVVISYGDIIYSSDILQQLLLSDYDISVVIDSNWLDYWSCRSENPLEDAETLKMTPDGLIHEIGSKTEHINEIEGQYIGLMKFSGDGSKKLRTSLSKGLQRGLINGKKYTEAYMTDLLQEMIVSGVKVNAVTTTSTWLEVDTVADLENECTITRLREIKNKLYLRSIE